MSRHHALSAIDTPFRGLRLMMFFLILLLLITLAAWWVASWMGKKPLSGSGGLYFPQRLVLDVPHFSQSDPRWANDMLGPTRETLAQSGCAVASAAMVLASYGADVDPGRLNRHVQSVNGYTPEGWLYWEAAATYAPDLTEKLYEDAPSYYLIDRNLLAGNPVIVRLRYPSGITHFVVIVGKQGFDYLIQDPGRKGEQGIYPLKDFGSPVEALRFYRKPRP